jgi:methionyl-tRNA formyltransferase
MSEHGEHRENGVLYFGDPRGALALLARGVELVGLVHGRRGGPGRAALVPRVRHLPRLTLPDLNDPAIVARLATLRPKLIVAAFYPRRIPRPVLDIAPGLNVHPSALPRFRGPDPCGWTIRAGDTETAVCVQHLADGLDEGDVLLREVHAVGPRETAGTLADRLEARGAELIAEVAVEWLAGRAPAAVPQTGEVTWAPMMAPDDAEVDFTRPAVEVDRFVRAANPWPGAFTGIGEANELLLLHAVTPVDAGRFRVLPPGTPYVREGVAHIRCGDEAVRLDRLTLGKHRLTGARLADLLL